MWLQKDQQFSKYGRDILGYISNHYDLELEDSKPFFLHNTLATVTLPSMVTKGLAVEEISSRWTFNGILILFWLWLWPQLQSNPIFSQDNPAYDNVPSNQVQLQKDQQFRRHIRQSLFWLYMFLDCDLDLEDSKPFFWKNNLAYNDASPNQVWQ